MVDSLPDRLEGYLEINRQRRARDQAPVAIVDDRAPTQGDDRPGLQHSRQGLFLELSERVLAVRGEDLGDGHPGFVLDQVIEVEERDVGALGDERAHDRLARAHEAEQGEGFPGVVRRRWDWPAWSPAATRACRRRAASPTGRTPGPGTCRDPAGGRATRRPGHRR